MKRAKKKEKNAKKGRMNKTLHYIRLKQLKDYKKDIIAFKEKYPNVGWTKTNIKKIYSLNKARKSMRNALGFTLEDDVQEVLNTYYTLSQLFSLGEKEILELYGFKE